MKGLWSNRAFTKLWAAETVSVFGSLITRAALPLTAILYLDASTFHVALLAACDLLPGFVAGLIAGAWVDRLRRRPILIAADIGRALLIGSIPLAAWAGALGMPQLYAVALLAGTLTIFFEVAYQSYLPALVSPEELVAGNSRLAASSSVAEVASFGIGGFLVQALTGPGAMAIDAVTFVASALFVKAIHEPEPPPVPAEERAGLWQEIVEGVRAVAHHAMLRSLAVATVAAGLAQGITSAVFMLYVTRGLGFHPGLLGAIFAVGGVTSLAGSAIVGPFTRRLGMGPALAVSSTMRFVGLLLIPLASGNGWPAVALLIGNQIVSDPFWTIYIVAETSLRQAVAPERLLGRVIASTRFVGLGAMLAGTLLGGALGGAIGLRQTLFLAVAVGMCGALWLALSPLRRLRDVGAGPAVVEAPTPAVV